MKFEWDNKKNEQVKNKRNISFERIALEIENNNVVDVLTHPNTQKYPGQKIYLVKCNDYIYAVPSVENKDAIFLKTIFKNRKYNKIYQKKAGE